MSLVEMNRSTLWMSIKIPLVNPGSNVMPVHRKIGVEEALACSGNKEEENTAHPDRQSQSVEPATTSIPITVTTGGRSRLSTVPSIGWWRRLSTVSPIGWLP